jgi:pimeloyl-ACP methyl ester carboxylesterase
VPDKDTAAANYGWRMEFERIVVETGRLAFPALAAGSGPPVVCWHGFPDHPATFEALAERLVAARRRVVAPFLRGHHPDTVDDTRYIDGITLAADAAAVAEALAEPAGAGVDMIGHDIGAGMVQRVAAAWPALLRRGVAIAVPPPTSLRTLFGDPAQLRRFFYVWLFQLDGVAESVLDGKLVDFLWETWSPGLTLLGAHRERVHELYGDPRLAGNAVRMYRANFDTSLHDPALAGLAERTEAPADEPLLLLAGEDDGCIAASMFAGAERGLGPGSRVEILPGVGHFMHVEQPETVARLALEWFDGIA